MSEDINFGAITEALNDKADRDLNNMTANIDYVVERYDDEEGNWYRVYKSGWLEQGGALTLEVYNYSFHKPFSKTPSLNVTRYSVYAGTAAMFDCTGATETPTNTGFTLSGTNFKSAYFKGGNWTACGQGA